MKLSVVIVNYNVKYYLEQCLRSVEKATQSISTEIFVVDNASSDGSLEYLKSKFPEIIFIQNEENLGFAKANNIAIRKSRGEYILLLNPDTLVAETTILKCIELMNNHPDAGGTGVRMLNTNGTFAYESRRGFPSPLTSFFKITGLCKFFPHSQLLGKYYLRFLDENKINQIDVISGAFMFLRKEALEKAGLLDEDFFMYGEDVDLSYRITKAGFQNYYAPYPIIHYKGESTKKDSFRYIQVFYDAMLIFFRKHYPHHTVIFSFPIKAAIYFRASIAYANQSIKKMKRKVGFKEQGKSPCFLILGNEKTMRDVRWLCQKNKLTAKHHYLITNETSLPKNIFNEGGKNQSYTHLIYDEKVFPHSAMIDHLYSLPSKEAEIGIYSPDEKIIITPQKIYH